jgi:hypothetical protein
MPITPYQPAAAKGSASKLTIGGSLFAVLAAGLLLL